MGITFCYTLYFRIMTVLRILLCVMTSSYHTYYIYRRIELFLHTYYIYSAWTFSRTYLLYIQPYAPYSGITPTGSGEARTYLVLYCWIFQKRECYSLFLPASLWQVSSPFWRVIRVSELSMSSSPTSHICDVR